MNIRQAIIDKLYAQGIKVNHLAKEAEKYHICSRGLVHKWLKRDYDKIEFDKAVRLAALIGIELKFELENSKI